LDFFRLFDPRFDLPDRTILRAKSRPHDHLPGLQDALGLVGSGQRHLAGFGTAGSAGEARPQALIPGRRTLVALEPSGVGSKRATLPSGRRFRAGGIPPDDYRSMNFSKYLIAKFRTILASGLQSSIHGSLRESRGRASQEGGLKKMFLTFLADESGATAIEYGLIAAGISLAIIATVNSLGSTLNTSFTTVNTSLK
jgi:pilus assembly protein Flp/PilA